MTEMSEVVEIVSVLGGFVVVMIPMSRGRGSARVLRVYRRLGLSALSLLVVLVLAYLGGYRFNMTPSMAMGWYRTSEGVPADLELGTIVCLAATGEEAPHALRAGVESGSLPASWREMELLKTVWAGEGAVVDYAVNGDGTATLVMGDAEARILPLRQTTEAGTPLPQVEYPLELEADEVWLHSDHPHSFDSRYFGPVKLAALSCTAEPAWTW